MAQDYRFTEFASRQLPGFRNRIVTLADLPALQDRYRGSDCYASCFLFGPDLPAHVRSNEGSVSGYRGACAATYLPFDFDAANLDHAMAAAQDLCRFVVDYWGAPKESVVAYFSGNKGFHVTAAAGVFGDVAPSVELPCVFRLLRRSTVEQARVRHPETVDYGIGDRLRLFRLPNTRHSRSGLYKIPLSLTEMLHGSPEEVRALAREPREQHFTDQTGFLFRHQVQALPDAVELYESAAKAAETRQSRYEDLPDPGRFLTKGDLSECFCEAEIEVFRQGTPRGARSRTALRLASRLRCSGYEQREADDLILAWNERNQPPERPGEMRRIVSVAYDVEEPYQFGCGTGENDPPETSLVFEACPYDDRLQCPTYSKFSRMRDA